MAQSEGGGRHRLTNVEAEAAMDAYGMEGAGGYVSRRNISQRGIQLTDAEAEAVMEAYAEEEVKEMTWTRWLVEKYLQHVRVPTVGLHCKLFLPLLSSHLQQEVLHLDNDRQNSKNAGDKKVCTQLRPPSQ